MISSSLAELISDLPRVNNDLYLSLSDDEKNIFDLLVSNSNLQYVRYNQSNIDDLIKQYNIIKGEILAGNDNPDLLKQLKITVLRLVNFGVLDIKQITPLLQELFLLI